MHRLREYTARELGILSAKAVGSTWASSQKGHDWLPSLPEKRVMRSLVCPTSHSIAVRNSASIASQHSGIVDYSHKSTACCDYLRQPSSFSTLRRTRKFYWAKQLEPASLLCSPELCGPSRRLRIDTFWRTLKVTLDSLQREPERLLIDLVPWAMPCSHQQKLHVIYGAHRHNHDTSLLECQTLRMRLALVPLGSPPQRTSQR